MEEFIPISILLILAVGLCVAIYIATHLLGPRNPTAAKMSTYECGVMPEGSARIPRIG